MEKKTVSKLAQSTIDSVKKKVSASVISEVITDWQSYFFKLERYKKTQKLLKVDFPIAYGIELEKNSSDSYRPRVVLYNLIDNSSNSLITIIDQTIKNKKGVDIVIKYTQHSDTYINACNLLKEQVRIDLFGIPTIEDIIEAIFVFIEKDCLGNCFWSCEAIMQISRLIDNKQSRELIFEKAVNLLRENIPNDLLEMQTNGIDKWIQKNRNLTTEEINKRVIASIEKYGL